jgi:hypothetical protein
MHSMPSFAEFAFQHLWICWSMSTPSLFSLPTLHNGFQVHRLLGILNICLFFNIWTIPGESDGENFDRASFLSEQPLNTQFFLETFIETQLFSNFIDAKVCE